MNRMVVTAIVAVVLVAAAVTGGIALAGGGDDGDGTPITGKPLTRASAVALAHTGGGRVTGSEVGDEEGAYEVEVTLPDGRQVDVHLDADFKVLGGSADMDFGSDEGAGDD